MEICSKNNCELEARTKGMCKKHYDSFRASERRGGYVKVGDFCKKGHKIEGENVQQYMNHGIERVRCRECNRVKPNVKIQMGDTCFHGHKIEGENAMWVTMSKSEDKKLRCATCMREKRRRYSSHIAGERAFNRRVAKFRREYNEQKRKESMEKILTVEVSGNGSYAGLNYLKMNKRAEIVWQPLYKAFEKNRSNCYKSPAEYIDYDEETPPSRNHAYALCYECPMLVECGRFANAYKPIIGVWGGEVWKDGKVLRNA